LVHERRRWPSSKHLKQHRSGPDNDSSATKLSGLTGVCSEGIFSETGTEISAGESAAIMSELSGADSSDKIWSEVIGTAVTVLDFFRQDEQETPSSMQS
jgi:hypothetical protein